MTPSLPTERKNATKSDSLDATRGKTNSTEPAKEMVTEKTVVKHIRRKRGPTTLAEVTMPFNFVTLHMPCEMDLPFNQITRMPAHCQWLYNNRYNSESFYRAYMLMKAEAFFFGQYHERLRRYELDARVFSYN
ncbi:uncharacterized protein LOC110179384 isoform X2 [Drosophila serrata]|nr:uncharacterized protein LOC110179384 isoform X2 [Drosophila serrata]